MRNHQWVWVVVALFIACLFTPLSASAQNQIVEGVHYVRAKCPDTSKYSCIRLINKPGHQIEADALASKFNMDMFELRAKNPSATIAVCRTNGVWRTGNVPGVKGRASDAIWKNCDPKNRRVVTIPGEILEVGASRALPYETIERTVKSIARCGADDSKCILAAIDPILPKDNATPEVIALPSPQPPSNSPPPVVLPKVDQMDDTVLQLRINNFDLVDGFLLALVLFAFVALAYVMVTKWRLSRVFSDLELDLADREKSLHFERAEKSKLSAALEALKASHAADLRKKDDEIALARAEQKEAQERFEQVARIHAPDVITSADLLRAIKDGFIQQIIDCAADLFKTGIELTESDFVYPITIGDAWRVFSDRQRAFLEYRKEDWQSAFLTRIQSIHSLVTSYSLVSSGGTDVLISLEQDIRACRDRANAGLKENGMHVDESASLMDVLIGFEDIYAVMKGALAKAKAHIETLDEGLRAAYVSSPSRVSKEERDPPRQCPTLTGLKPVDGSADQPSGRPSPLVVTSNAPPIVPLRPVTGILAARRGPYGSPG
jgi:hypothetical protein